MKLLQIHTELFGGGIETFVVALCNELARTGEDISLCCIFEPRGGCWNKVNPDVKTFSLHKQKKGFSIHEPIQLYKMLRCSTYDVVHVHGFIAYYALAIVLLHHRIRFVYTVHNRADKEGGKWDRMLFPIKKFILKHWVQPVTISEESSKSFKDMYRNCHFEQITNGIALPQNNRLQHREEWLFIHPGRICEQKNQLVLCEAFRTFRQTYPQAKLIIAGEVMDEQLFNQLHTYWDTHIEYIGFVNDINERLSRAGALCLPSLWEGMPIVLLEAMANECIPICSPVDGIKNVVEDGINGILSTDCSKEGYLEALLRYGQMTNEARDTMRKHTIEKAQTMGIKQTAIKYLDIYTNK